MDAPLDSGVDPAFARSALIRCLERLEAQFKPTDKYDLFREDPVSLFSFWQEGDAVVRFSNQMVRLLRESMGNAASIREIEVLIETAIARQVGLTDSLPSRIRTMELDRLASIARGAALRTVVSESVDKESYVSAIRATRKLVSGKSLTAIGRVFLELKGRDAIRWLLHVEAAQSFGPSDPWRISRETANNIVQRGSWSLWADGEDGAGFVYNFDTIRRLAAFGLVSVSDEEMQRQARTDVKVLPMGRQLLSELADVGASSMSVLAESVLADLTLSAANSVSVNSGRATASFEATAVSEATVRQSRLVAHEIRNMLVPVKTALGAFYREVQMAEHPGDVVARRKESIDRGIDSVFRFIGQLVELSQFAATPPEPFDMLVALRDAVSVIESESGRRIEQVLPAQLPPVSGHRARVVTAIANILRNATQAATSESPVIRIEAESIEGASAVRLLVEDNGPGVPESMRRAIFDEGVSLRGGSGLGLALVREVFEKEMRGLVACEASSLGGARFVVRVPTTGTERP